MKASLRNQLVDALATSRLNVGGGNCLTVAGVHTISTLPRCIRVGIPLKQRILAIPETLILPTGDCLTFAGVHNIGPLPRCIRAGTPLKQRILAIPETLRLPTGNCLTVARVHTINTLPRCISAGIPFFTSHWVGGADYTGKAARRCRGGVSVGSFASNPGVNTCRTQRQPLSELCRQRGLSRVITKGDTLMRRLTVETVDGGITGERVAWPLPTAIWARRRQGETKTVNGSRRVQALSTVMIEGGTHRGNCAVSFGKNAGTNGTVQ